MLNKKRLILPSVIGCALLAVSNVQARYENDVRLGTLQEAAVPDFVYPDSHVGDTSQAPELEEEVQIYFEQGYHPVTVLFYAMRNGMSVNKAVDIAEQAGIVKEHLEKAINSLTPVLPGGVCGTSYFVKDPTAMPGSYSLTELKDSLTDEQNNGSGGEDDEPTLEDIITKYFDDNEVISTNEDDPNLHQVHDNNWPQAVGSTPPGGVPDNAQAFVDSGIPAHIHASADELLALADQSKDYWFFQDSPLGQGQVNSESLSANAPIEIGLYPDSKQAVISPWQLERINQAKLDGERLPVMFFYNAANERPLSQIAKKIGFPQVANAYIRNGIKVSPVPSWEEGNYHTQATAQQLQDLFDLPAKEDIPEERYTKALSSIDSGKPLQIAFVGGKIFLGDPDRAVAMSQDGGYDLLPVNVSYVDLEPSESDFGVCDNNAFPFAGGGLGAIGGNTPSGIVFIPPCVPETEIIRTPRRVRVSVSPDRFKTVIDERVIVTVPCPPQ